MAEARLLVSMGASILPAMHEPEGARPRTRSPFAAAFLSLIFPGLGQLYAGAPLRAMAFAAGPILLLALSAGMVLRVERIALLGFLVDPAVLGGVRVQIGDEVIDGSVASRLSSLRQKLAG